MTDRLRLIFWGAGEVGAATARDCVPREDVEIVGMKVWSESKDGRDVGELLGTAPIGVKATTDAEALFALNADCVIITAAAKSMWDGLDDDVIRFLEAGTNVIATTAYHSVARQHRFSHQRATAARLADACATGGASLYGVGVHPSFMVDVVAVTLARTLQEVDHLRFVEALDFSTAPEGMWGGLDALGFGRDPSEFNAESFVGQIGDLYYGDVVANVAYNLYGAHCDDVRVEHELIGIPASETFQVGSTTIAEGTTAALHMTHRGYLGDKHFFTNEEIWYLGPVGTFRGDNLPFGSWKQGLLCYTIEIDGKTANVKTQLEFEITENTTQNPITVASVGAIIDAIGPICRAAPGIYVDDAGPHFKLDSRIHSAV